MKKEILAVTETVLKTAFAILVCDMARQTATGKGIERAIKTRAQKITAKVKRIRENWN